MPTKVEALIELLRENGGTASWSHIYGNFERFYPQQERPESWKAGIRGVLYRELKNQRSFKQVADGTFALLEYNEENIDQEQEDEARPHSYMQGLLVEIGNREGYDTYCADPSEKFRRGIQISQLTTLREFPNGVLNDKTTETAKRIDVIWFPTNRDKYPEVAIEVVNSMGTLQSSLNRLIQLAPFQTSFAIISPDKKKDTVENALTRYPFSEHEERFKVRTYGDIIKYHQVSHTREMLKLTNT